MKKQVNGKDVELTPEEEVARNEEAANQILLAEEAAIKTAERALKFAGVEIDGKLCSATRIDQNGLTAISVGVILARGAGNEFPDTLFEFENGAELLITDATFDSHYAIWTTFRQAFFVP